MPKMDPPWSKPTEAYQPRIKSERKRVKHILSMVLIDPETKVAHRYEIYSKRKDDEPAAVDEIILDELKIFGLEVKEIE